MWGWWVAGEAYSSVSRLLVAVLPPSNVQQSTNFTAQLD